ncbi:hypothetical protein GGR56DRAFT_679163 [Xylariaceae sp. FL0804]|nr:hypothetical protein GGR56DRAFT_679163 [Xylariaceae sp. FL0804]
MQFATVLAAVLSLSASALAVPITEEHPLSAVLKSRGVDMGGLSFDEHVKRELAKMVLEDRQNATAVAGNPEEMSPETICISFTYGC